MGRRARQSTRQTNHAGTAGRRRTGIEARQFHEHADPTVPSTQTMRSFDSLTEREILALAISQEEEDARIYDDFAEGLSDRYPEQAEKFKGLRREEDGHRHRLLELYRERFVEHLPLIRREDVRGFVRRRPVWLTRPLGLKAVQKAAETMEVETKRFYEVAARRATDAGIRQLLGDLAEEERA